MMGREQEQGNGPGAGMRAAPFESLLADLLAEWEETESPIPDLTMLGKLFEGQNPEEEIVDKPAEIVEQPAPEIVMAQPVEPEPQPVEELAVETAPLPLAGPLLAEGERYVVFELDDDRFAIPLASVVETESVPHVTPLPGLPESIRGVFNLRGEILPLIDLRLLVGLPASDLPQEGKMLVVRSKRIPHPCAFAVDSLQGLAALREEDLTPPREREGDKIQPLLAGIGEHKDRPLSVFDVERLFTGTELDELAA